MRARTFPRVTENVTAIRTSDARAKRDPDCRPGVGGLVGVSAASSEGFDVRSVEGYGLKDGCAAGSRRTLRHLSVSIRYFWCRLWRKAESLDGRRAGGLSRTRQPENNVDKTECCAQVRRGRFFHFQGGRNSSGNLQRRHVTLHVHFIIDTAVRHVFFFFFKSAPLQVIRLLESMTFICIDKSGGKKCKCISGTKVFDYTDSVFSLSS